MHFHSLLFWAGLLSSSTTAVLATLPRTGQHDLARSPMHRRQSRNLSQQPDDVPVHHAWKRTMGPTWTGAPTLATSKVKTGVAAMQLTVVGSTHVLIIDKAEDNPVSIKGSGANDKGVTHPAWVQWLDFRSGEYKALDAQTNSFCAGGSWLSNGTMVSVGGNPRVNAASYYDANGLTSVRIFKQCDDSTCSIWEDTNTVRMSSSRWYASPCRLQDGSLIIMGGMTEGGFNNANATDNPTFEYFPSKHINNGLPLYSAFLHDSLNSNLFPFTALLPGGNIFVAANERTMIYNWQKNVETRLPNIPNGVRITYPFSAASTLLPLTIANNYVPEVLFCGGSTIDDSQRAYSMSSETPGSTQCARMALSAQGIKAGWSTEQLPQARIMGDAVLTPDGKVVIVNGAATGVAGYSNVHNPVGQSNADNPDYRGVIYDPLLPLGQRISTNMPTSSIARMYHSVATLIPTGEILITGSNPNADVSKAEYATEYRVEFLSPPYMSKQRPSYTWVPKNILYGKSFKIIIDVPSGTVASDISIVLMDFGFKTHALPVDQKLIELPWRSWNTTNNQILVKSPKDGSYFAPGYGWLFLVVNGVPSVGQKVMVGEGNDPPFSAAARANMMAKTKNTHGAAIW